MSAKTAPREQHVMLMRINLLIITLIAILLSFFAYYNARYLVGDDDQVVITQFGKIIGEAKTVPGEYFKIPIIQKPHYFSKKYQLTEWNQQVPTKDIKFLNISTRVIWQISDPQRFYKNLNSKKLADDSVIQTVGAIQRIFITSHTLAELIGKNLDDSQIVNIECDRMVEREFLESTQKSILATGITVNNVEAKVASLIKR